MVSVRISSFMELTRREYDVDAERGMAFQTAPTIVRRGLEEYRFRSMPR
jgi:hypothetical protein